MLIRAEVHVTTHTFDLLFLAVTPGKMRHWPIAHVYVKRSMRNDYGGKGTDKILIGAECVSLREFEREIEQLKSDLDEVKKRAARKCAAAKRAGRD
jgi:hypothetical protein